MRDRTKAARAVLRSEFYWDAHPNAGELPLLAGGIPPRTGPRDGADAPRRRRGTGAPSPFTALALLGLLDLFMGG
jgi:hypothetical protein